MMYLFELQLYHTQYSLLIKPYNMKNGILVQTRFFRMKQFSVTLTLLHLQKRPIPLKYMSLKSESNGFVFFCLV